MWQIGAEGGMWDVPVPVKELVLAPAERADVLVDFSTFAGQHGCVMKNHQPQKPVIDAGAAARPQVMQIRVGDDGQPAGPADDSREPAGARRPTCADPVDAARFITLNEIDVDDGRPGS